MLTRLGWLAAPLLLAALLSSAACGQARDESLSVRLVLPDGRGTLVESWEGGASLPLDDTVLLERGDVRSATVVRQPEPALQIQLTPDGTHRFQQATREHTGQRLAVVVDGRVAMAPVVREEISSGALSITGPPTDTLEQLRAALE